MDYIIGINLGYENTTAFYCNPDSEILYCLHILEGDTLVKTAVCRNDRTGEWLFAKDICDYALPDFTQHFIAPLNEISPKNREAFAAFVKLVFEHILENQSFLEYNQKTGERNFEIYVSYPSGWSKEATREYKKFISKLMPVDWVVAENDASYFKFKAETNLQKSSMLVIDLGSSTIDVTAYDENGKCSFFNSNIHGDSAVENLIYEYFEEHDPYFNKAKQEGETKCNTNGLNWRNAVLHYIRYQKKHFYEQQMDCLVLDLSNRAICNS